MFEFFGDIGSFIMTPLYYVTSFVLLAFHREHLRRAAQRLLLQARPPGLHASSFAVAVVDAFFAQRGRRSVLGTYDIDRYGDTTLPDFGAIADGPSDRAASQSPRPVSRGVRSFSPSREQALPASMSAHAHAMVSVPEVCTTRSLRTPA